MVFGIFKSGRSRLVHVDRFGEPLDPQPTAARAPAPTTTPRRAPERPTAAREPAMTDGEARELVAQFRSRFRWGIASAPPAPRSAFANLPRDVAGIVAAQVARTPAPARRPRSSHAPTVERTNDLLSMTPLGRDALRLRERHERDAAARRPAPISAAVRQGLAATHLGRQVLADRQRADPEGEAAAAGLDPARRRELLEGSTLGRAMLVEESRRSGGGR